MLPKLITGFSATILLAAQALAQTPGTITLDDGTPIRLRTTNSISSADAHVDDRVDFEVVEDIKVGDVVVVRHGTTAIGTVTGAQSKRRMGRGGKLDVNIDFTKTVTGEKVSLRGVKEVQGGGHTGAMTGAMVGTAIVFWPAAPFFLFMHGKDITVPKGHEFNVYSSGAVTLNAAAVVQGGRPAASNLSAGTAGMLAVASTPNGAEILIDNVFVGSTPSSVPVSLGTHTITVQKPGYSAWQRTIQVNGGTVNVAAELLRSARAQNSALSVR
jgi:PEGA domain